MKRVCAVLLLVILTNCISGVAFSVLAKDTTVDELTAVSFDNGFESDAAAQLLKEEFREGAEESSVFCVHLHEKGGKNSLSALGNTKNLNGENNRNQENETYDAVDITPSCIISYSETSIQSVFTSNVFKRRMIIFRKEQYV